VYKTNDFGKTWISIAGNLPDEPINVIKEDHKNPNLLFIGTDKTVHVTIDGGKNWAKMKNNMPTVPIYDLVIHPRENDLVVGAHGRGVFITDISPLQELTPEVLARDVYLFEIEPKVKWVIPRQTVVSSQNFWGENQPFGIMVNYYLKNNIDRGVKITVYKGAMIVRELMGPGKAGLNSVEWRLDKLRKRTEEEIAQWRNSYLFFFDEPYTKFQQVFYHGSEFDLDKPEHISTQVPPGEYTVKLTVSGRELKKKAVILKDYWYDK
jgi:hypothetical protein